MTCSENCWKSKAIATPLRMSIVRLWRWLIPTPAPNRIYDGWRIDS